MANEYYTPSGSPTTNADGSSAVMRAEFASIQTGLDKLPVLAANGNKAVFVNAGGTALTSVTAATARTNLGLGTAATVNTGTSGATIPLLNAANTFVSGQKIGAGSGAVDTIIDGGVAIRAIRYRTAGSDRFVAFVNATAEGGSSVGSDFSIARYDDAGGYLGAPLSIKRSDGGVWLASATGLSKGDGTLNAVNLYVQGSAVLKQSEIFVSADQTITAAGSLTIAHGLGAAPRLVLIAMVCQTAELGYSIGDVVQTGAYDMPATFTDATNIGVRFYNGSQSMVHKTTGVFTAITSTSWKMRFLAIK